MLLISSQVSAFYCNVSCGMRYGAPVTVGEVYGVPYLVITSMTTNMEGYVRTSLRFVREQFVLPHRFIITSKIANLATVNLALQRHDL